MPITITPENPAGLVGPGLALRFESSLPSPFPSTALWTMSFVTQSDQARFYEGQLHQTSGIVFLTPGITTGWGPPIDLTQDVVKEADPVQVNAIVQLAGGGPADDSGQIIAPWSSQSGVPALIAFQAQQGQGLTPAQAQDLAQTQDATWPAFPVDTLTLTPVAGTPVGGTVSANLTSPVFGVIVRIASVPPQLLPSTADGDYWVSGLAVVRVYRGTDLWLRVPVHTSSKLINLWVEGLALGLADAVLNAGWLLNLTLQVSFREGVTGTVHLMRVP